MLRAFICLFLAFIPSFGRHVRPICGTHPNRLQEELFLHRRSARALRARLLKSGRPVAAEPAAGRDIGNVAVLEDTGGIVARRNDFDLNGRTVAFLATDPAATRYVFQTAGSTYDDGAAANGSPLSGLGDDDTRNVPLPFDFPYYGATYRDVWVNSDGNLTFTAGSDIANDRSLGDLVTGLPRIGPLYEDLDPSLTTGGVRVLSESDKVVVSWVSVPEYDDFGLGVKQTFQVRLYPNGRIEFAYKNVATLSAVVGISPGTRGSSTLVSFLTDATGEYTGAVAERFTNTSSIDLTTAAQTFFDLHEDAYDYVLFYNNMGIDADGAVAFTIPVRQKARGIGKVFGDYGREFGSAARLQAVQNMGPLNEYPRDPAAVVQLRSPVGDTPVTIIAHEVGHLFLAYASDRDPNDSSARPMLGFQNAHWNSAFNSDASLLEGNRIGDDGPGASPRFMATAAVKQYSALDQYLMGFRAPEDVEPEYMGGLFLVKSPSPALPRYPSPGLKFNGQRQDIALQDVIIPEGRRTPDSTVAQRHFRMAFVLIVPRGTQPAADELAQLEDYRASFEEFYRQATGNRAFADVSLKRAMHLSVFPAAGVISGRTATATVSVDTAPAADLAIVFTTTNGNVSLPDSLVIPAGEKSASFTITAVREGVEDLTAAPQDSTYETAWARIQVAPPESLKLVSVSGLPGPVTVRLTDINDLPYPGATLEANGSGMRSTVVTDASGQAAFDWIPGDANPLQVSLQQAPGVSTGISAGMVASVLNAASFAPGIVRGGLARIYGAGLAAGASASADYPWPASLGGVQVTLNGESAPLLYVSDGEIGFLAPPDLPLLGTASLMLSNARGVSGPYQVPMRLAQPGIFVDSASDFGEVINASDGTWTSAQPAQRGATIRIFCTGLGEVSGGRTLDQPVVTIGGVQARVSYSGLAAGYLGRYEVDAQVPAAVQPGIVPLSMQITGVTSNEVRIGVQ